MFSGRYNNWGICTAHNFIYTCFLSVIIIFVGEFVFKMACSLLDALKEIIVIFCISSFLSVLAEICLPYSAEP